MIFVENVILTPAAVCLGAVSGVLQNGAKKKKVPVTRRSALYNGGEQKSISEESDMLKLGAAPSPVSREQEVKPTVGTRKIRIWKRLGFFWGFLRS